MRPSSLQKYRISEETTAVIADGAYAGKELQEEAAGKNIGILTTGLRGRVPRDILTKFSLSEDEHTVLRCPAGNGPKASSYNTSNNPAIILYGCLSRYAVARTVSIVTNAGQRSVSGQL